MMWKGSQYFTGKDEEYYNGDSAATKKRRNIELMYNPQNHMRRRELTEVLDMHRYYEQAIILKCILVY